MKYQKKGQRMPSYGKRNLFRPQKAGNITLNGGLLQVSASTLRAARNRATLDS